jgi:hypothetical protein
VCVVNTIMHTFADKIFLIERRVVIELVLLIAPNVLSTAKGGAEAASVPRPPITLRVRDVQSKAGRGAERQTTNLGVRGSNPFGRANEISNLRCADLPRTRAWADHGQIADGEATRSAPATSVADAA